MCETSENFSLHLLTRDYQPYRKVFHLVQVFVSFSDKYWEKSVGVC